jgi:glutathione S-transferase
MKLYHSPILACSRRETIALRLMGLELKHREIEPGPAVQRAALRVLNANDKVGVIEEGGLALWESHATMQHLCDRTTGQARAPSSRAARVEIDRSRRAPPATSRPPGTSGSGRAAPSQLHAWNHTAPRGDRTSSP